MVDQDTMKEIIRRIVHVAKPDRIVLFGSAARGEARVESDIDLLIVKKDVPHRRQLAQEIYVSLIGIPLPIDVIVVTPEDIRRNERCDRDGHSGRFNEGIEIYAA